MCFTYGWFCYVLPVTGLEDGAHQSLDAAHLAHSDIVGRQHLGEHLEKAFHWLVLRGKNKYR